MIEQQERPAPRILSRRKAARALDISLTTLDRRISSGDLRAKKHGHFTVIMQSEIDRFLENLPEKK